MQATPSSVESQPARRTSASEHTQRFRWLQRVFLRADHERLAQPATGRRWQAAHGPTHARVVKPSPQSSEFPKRYRSAAPVSGRQALLHPDRPEMSGTHRSLPRSRAARSQLRTIPEVIAKFARTTPRREYPLPETQCGLDAVMCCFLPYQIRCPLGHASPKRFTMYLPVRTFVPRRKCSAGLTRDVKFGGKVERLDVASDCSGLNMTLA